MKLRKKTLFIVGATLVVAIALLYFLSDLRLIEGFKKLEEKNVIDSVHRVRDIQSRDLKQLTVMVRDWAEGDDVYEFAEKQNAKFVETNLQEHTLADLGVNFIIFIDSKGQVIFSRGIEIESKKKLELPPDFAQLLAKQSPLVKQNTSNEGSQGLIMLSSGPVWVATHPILPTSGKGPSHGTLVFARYFDDAMLKEQSELTSLNLAIIPASTASGDAELSKVLEETKEDATKTIVAAKGDDYFGYAVLRDTNDKPALLLQVKIPQTILHQGQIAMEYYFFSLLLLGIITVAVVLWLVERLVLSRLLKINREVQAIRTSNDLKRSIVVRGKDELANLAEEINGFVEQIKNYQVEVGNSEEKYRLLLNSIKSPILALNLDRTVLYYNEAFAGLVNLKPEELVGEKADKFFPLYKGKDVAQIYEEVIKSGVSQEVEEQINGHDLRCRFFRSPWGGLILFDDITDVKAAQVSIERHKRAILSLYEFSHEINKSTNMEDLVSRMVALLSDNTSVLGVGFYILSGPHRYMTLQSSYLSEKADFKFSNQLELDNPFVEEVGKTNKAWIADDYEKKSYFLTDAKNEGTEQVLIFTLQSGTELMGILNMTLSGYDEDTKSFLEMISAEIGTGMKHKQAESSLRKSEIFVRSIIERSPIGISVRNRVGGLITYNEAWKKLWGMSEEDVMQDFSKERTKLLFDSKDNYLDKYQDEVKRVYEQGGFFHIPELEIKSPRPNAAKWVSQYFYSIGNSQHTVEQVVILTVDITEQKRSEQLQNMSYQISEAVNTTDNLQDLFVLIHQIIGGFIKTNNFVIALYDPKTDMVTAPYYVDEHDVYPGPRKLGKSLVDNIIRTGEPIRWCPGEYEQVKARLGLEPIGTPAASWLGVPLKTKSHLIGVVVVQSYRDDVVFDDIDYSVLEFASTQIALAIERKQAEEELRTSNEFNQAVIAHSPLSITIRDLKSRLTTYNQTWRDMWKITDDELVENMQKERPLDEVFGFLGEWKDKCIDVYKHGGYLFIPEIRDTFHRQGTPKWVSYYFYAITDEHGAVSQVVNVTEDITERKRNEELSMVVFKISEAANIANNLRDLFQSIHQILNGLIDAPNLYFALYDEENDRVTFPYYVDGFDVLPDVPFYELRKLDSATGSEKNNCSLTDYIIQKAEPLFFKDGKAEELCGRLKLGIHGKAAYSWMGVPLKVVNKVIGVLVIQSYTSDINYSEDDLRILQFVTNQIALAIERKRSEEALLSSELLNRAVIENSPLAITVRNPKGQLILYNKTWRDMWLITDEELWENMHGEASLEERFSFMGEWCDQVIKFYTEGGSLIIPEVAIVWDRPCAVSWVSYVFYAIRDEYGKVAMVVLITEDITKRKQSQLLEEAIFRISKAANSAENLDDLYVKIHQVLGELIRVNNFLIALYDDEKDLLSFPYSVDEVEDLHVSRKLGNGFTDYVIKSGKPLLSTRADLPAFKEKYGIEQIGTIAEYWIGIPLKTAEKTIGALVVQSYQENQKLGEDEQNILQFVSTQVAMTIERKRTEEALRTSEEKFRQIAESINEVFWVRDFKTRELLYVSPSYDVLTGYPGSGLYSDYDKYQVAIHPDDLKRVKKAVDQQYKDGYFNEEYRILKPDGSVLWVRDRTFPVYDEAGEIVRLVGIAEDVNSRKRAEQIQLAIVEISEAAHTVANLQDLYASIHRILGSIINAKNFYIAIYDEPTDTFYFPYHVDEYDSTPDPRKMGKSITEYVYKTGESLLAKPAEFNEIRKKHGFKLQGSLSKYWLGVPLKVHGKGIGVLVVQSYSEDIRIDEEDKEILQFVSTQVAMAIERKRAIDALRSSEEFNRAIVENSPLGIAVRSPSGKLLSYNETWKSIWGLTNEELKQDLEEEGEGRELKQRFGLLEQWKLKAAKVYDIGGNLYIPEIATESRKTKDKIWLSFYFYTIKDEEGKVDRVVNLIEDITERKKAEEKLHLVLAELEKANAELRKLDELKTEFLNMTSHELKTPLTSILGYSELLFEGVLGDIHPNQTKALDGIIRNAKQLRKLVDELLETSRIESGTLKLDKGKCEVRELLSEVIESLQSHAQEHLVSLELKISEKLPLVTCDYQRITQVLYNLIDNAIKFSPAVSKIQIIAKNTQKMVLIGVKDHGVGISPSDQEKVFERFYQVDMSESRSKGGLGLGLAISRGIVEAHMGRIWVESEVGKGSTFWFSLPV